MSSTKCKICNVLYPNDFTRIQHEMGKKHKKKMLTQSSVQKQSGTEIENRKTDEQGNCSSEVPFVNDLDINGSFNEHLMYVVSQVRLTPEQVQNMANLCSDLQNDLRAAFPGCIAWPFGSMVAGLGVKGSDVDCFVEFYDNYREEDTYDDRIALQRFYIKKAKSILFRHRNKYSQVVPIPRASTPIIKFYHIPTGTNCDINFKDCVGVLNSDLIRYLLTTDKRLLPMFILLKYMMGYYNISGRSRFTNYSLSMMIFFYLQLPPHKIIPTVYSLQRNPEFDNYQDGWNCGFSHSTFPKSNHNMTIPEILEGFFKFYAEFDYKSNVICPLLGITLPKTAFDDVANLPDELGNYKYNLDNGKPKFRTEPLICVQDPFRLCHNVTAIVNVKTLNDFQTVCELAAEACEKANKEKSDGTLMKSLLELTFESCNIQKYTIKLPCHRHNLDSNQPEEVQIRNIETKIREFVKVVFNKIIPCIVKEHAKNLFFCECDLSVWDVRHLFVEETKNFDNILLKEIYITDRVLSSTIKSEKSKILFTFYADFQIKMKHNTIIMKLRPGPDQLKNFYDNFIDFCKNKIFQWYLSFQQSSDIDFNGDLSSHFKPYLENIKIMPIQIGVVGKSRNKNSKAKPSTAKESNREVDEKSELDSGKVEINGTLKKQALLTNALLLTSDKCQSATEDAGSDSTDQQITQVENKGVSLKRQSLKSRNGGQNTESKTSRKSHSADRGSHRGSDTSPPEKVSKLEITRQLSS